jgi:hypothetical protein
VDFFSNLLNEVLSNRISGVLYSIVLRLWPNLINNSHHFLGLIEIRYRTSVQNIIDSLKELIGDDLRVREQERDILLLASCDFE